TGGRSGHIPTKQSTAPAVPTTVPTTGPITAPAALDLSGTFSSPQYGYTMSVAPEWTISPATLTWSGPDNNSVDNITFRDGGGGITAGSEALLPGQTWAEWLNEFQPP